MSKITESARDEECQIRTPFCNFNSETTVFCHLPAQKMGGKAMDIHGAYGCSDCHDVVDGRRPVKNYDRGQIALWFHQAVIRTQSILVEKGLLEYG